MTSPAADHIPVLPDVTVNACTPASPAIGRVVESRVCTASKKSAGWVRHISIDVSGTPLEGAFCAGQSFGVLPPGQTDKGKAHKLRLYSIASPTAGEDGEGKVLATTCKRLIDEHWDDHSLFLGVASNYLCDLKEGDEVRVTGPAGKRFVLPADPTLHDYIFFSTGTGIAPFRGMIRDLQQRAPESRVTLVSGSPYATDLLYHQDLQQIAQDHPRFRYVTAISRGPNDHGPDNLYVQDRIRHDPNAGTDDSIDALLRSDRTLIYVCGLAGMELGIFRGLAQTLEADHAAQFMTVDPEAGPPDQWNRRMISRQIKVTKRTFLEVY